MLARAAAIKQSGVNLSVLFALSDSGHPGYEAKHAEAMASFGCPVFACTPDRFPSMMASALTGKDLRSWAAEETSQSSGELQSEATAVARSILPSRRPRLCE